MPRIISQNSRVYPSGTRKIEVALPVGMSGFIASLSREGWPDTGEEIAQLRIEQSFDGGVTWPHFGQIGVRGGEHVSPFYGLMGESTLRFDCPQPNNPDRLLRAQLTNAVPIRTAVAVDVN